MADEKRDQEAARTEQAATAGIASRVVLAILLTVVLRGLLENFFGALTGTRTLGQLVGSWPPDTITWLRLWQFLVFLLLLARFYGGAYRFIEEETPAPSVPLLCVNLVGTFGLFSLFYVVATKVWTIDLFYLFLFVMHVFDGFWFFAALLVLPPTSPLIRVLRLYLLFDAITLVTGVLMAWKWWSFFLAGSNYVFQWFALSLLVVVSAIDFVVLRRFYFDADGWRRDPNLWPLKKRAV